VAGVVLPSLISHLDHRWLDGRHLAPSGSLGIQLGQAFGRTPFGQAFGSEYPPVDQRERSLAMKLGSVHDADATDGRQEYRTPPAQVAFDHLLRVAIERQKMTWQYGRVHCFTNFSAQAVV
jgi:hypothetical protein